MSGLGVVSFVVEGGRGEAPMAMMLEANCHVAALKNY
jgi:hypothetical protein